MASSALGTKRHCQSCDGKFYDLNKAPIICPSCQTAFDPETLLKSRRSKPAPAAPVKPQKAATSADDDSNLDDNIDDVDNDIDDDSEVLEDDSDLIVVSADDDDDENTGVVSDDMPIDDDLDTDDTDDEAEEE